MFGVPPSRHRSKGVAALFAFAVLFLVLAQSTIGPAPASNAMRAGNGNAALGATSSPTALATSTLTVTGASPASISLAWGATSDPTFSSYEIERSTNGSGGPWTAIGTVDRQTSTDFFVEGLAPGQVYWWQVVERGAAGTGTGTNVVQEIQPSIGHLRVASVSANSVRLEWTNSATYGGNVRFVGYTVLESVAGAAPKSVGTISSVGTTTASPSGLVTGTGYRFTVVTTDGCYSASNCISSTPSSVSNSNPVNATPSLLPSFESVTFEETGLPASTNWTVAVDGVSHSSTGSTVTFLEPAGTYAYAIGMPPGELSSPASGAVTVTTSAASVPIAFHALASGTTTVTFSESGLSLGSSWWVTLGGGTEHGAGPTIAFVRAPGTYPFTIGGPTGELADPSTGTTAVSLLPDTISATFGYLADPPANSTSDPPPADPITHVVLVMLENQEVTNLWAGAPYERYLASTYGNATNYYAACHSSTSQYLAVTSGRTFGCQSVSTDPGFNVTHLGDLLDAKGLSWMAYQESMPYPCDTTSSGAYLDYHEPFFFYQDVLRNQSRCVSHIVNSAEFNESVQNGTLPTFSLYTPNYIDDGHGPEYSPWNSATGLPHIEAFLKGFLPPILNHTGRYSSAAEQQLVNHTAFILLYDEGVTNAGYTVDRVFTPGCFDQTGVKETACGGHTQATVISPYSLHRTYTADSTTYSVESTIEWLFGLPSDGGLDGTPHFPPMKSLFSFSSNGRFAAAQTVVAPAPTAAAWLEGLPLILAGASALDLAVAATVSVGAIAAAWIIVRPPTRPRLKGPGGGRTPNDAGSAEGGARREPVARRGPRSGSRRGP